MMLKIGLRGKSKNTVVFHSFDPTNNNKYEPYGVSALQRVLIKYQKR